MEISTVFDDNFAYILLDILWNKIKRRIVMLENTEVENALDKSWKSQNTNNMSCSYCQVDFTDVATQREHYKLDWHRLNLKQFLLGRNSITAQEFELRNGNDDITSISGSDSEKEDTLDTFAASQKMMLVQGKNEQIYAFHKYIGFNKKLTNRIDLDELELLTHVRFNLFQSWTVLMLVDGHFAGAVFKKHDLVSSSTFDSNTWRQEQGGSQSSKDNKSGGSNTSSRKYNEQALRQHIHDVVEQWKLHLEARRWFMDNLIFYRAPGQHNKSILFGAHPILTSSNPQLRPVSFPTGPANLKEVQRIHSVLATVHTYENLDAAVKDFEKRRVDKQRLLNPDRRKSRIRTRINRAKSREIVERPLRTKHSSETNSSANSLSESEEFESIPLNSSDHKGSFKHLQEFEGIEKPKEKSSKKSKPKKSKTKKLQEQEIERKNEIINIICKGKLLKLKELIENVSNNLNENKIHAEKQLKMNFVNEILDEDGNSLLHMAAMNEHGDLVKCLLENDSNPCMMNKKHQTAYSATSSEEVREVMREFARKYPEKYDYYMAKIPVNTLIPEELAQKKKIQKKIEGGKENIVEVENEIKRKRN